MPRFRLSPSALLVASAALSACALQPLVIVPDAPGPTDLHAHAHAPADAGEHEAEAAPKIKAAVGYFIPNAYRALQLRAGDGTAYTPYRDIELAYRKMLASVFDSVVRVDSLTDAEAIRAAGLQYLILPELSTGSTSLSVLPGMPATFMAELTSKVRCTNGLLLANPQAVGQSTTTMREAMIDRSAAGRRAMADALAQTQKLLREAKLDPGTTAATCAAEVG